MGYDIIIAGVGGQGTLLTSRILGVLAQRLGYDVKVSEVHGMAQRGGSVVTYVRMAEKVHSPLIEEGGADFMLAFEQLEALRYAHYLKPGGHAIVNLQKIPPMPVVMGTMSYPSDVIESLNRLNIKLHAMDALSKALELGNARVVNLVMIGVMAGLMSVDKQIWMETIAECVPPRTVALNQAAFEAGLSSQV